MKAIKLNQFLSNDELKAVIGGGTTIIHECDCDLRQSNGNGGTVSIPLTATEKATFQNASSVSLCVQACTNLCSSKSNCIRYLVHYNASGEF